jgi:protein SCO1
MRRVRLRILAVLALAGCVHRYDARGVVLRTAPSQITISHDAVPGYMDAMVMPFELRGSRARAQPNVGDRVAFRLNVNSSRTWIDRLRIVSAPRVDAGLERSPVRRVLLPIGGQIGDFRLVDQEGRPVTPATWRGQVVAVTFLYTRCPLPDYCPRLLANFKAVAERFRTRLGTELTLAAITMDPRFDTSEVLARYARERDAVRPGWLFLTGAAPEISRICEAFGVDVWPEEGLISHSLQTAVLDREGILVGTIEGRDYSSRQLGDLIGSVLDRTVDRSG